jgi:hypothetical protein
MRKFVAGVVVGLLLGSSFAAIAQSCIGYGTLHNWVVIVRAQRVCSDPFVDGANKLIECK